MKNIILFLLIFVTLTSCGNDPLPKPKGYLRLEYPKAEYTSYSKNLPFTFDRNTLSDTIKFKNLQDNVTSFGLNIEYKKLKGTIYLTYKAIDGQERLIKYLKNAQNFTQEHTKKADAIEEVVWENPENKVYGMFYEVGGNAASQSQFYITDSINHFLTGSLYFYAKPNYDSILPAANYLQKDIKRIMESVRWQ
ncbi:gliding motility lipoprotein GldD [Olleya aquimaris]|uniref:Gliding motility lipoprotein GldD n=1 Tax=Olleya sediminilitoris TaxID=2795739 RepID=A0ABS1WNJ4_9FLAO|nr:gliding motility lipoprotein GldD [Olleya sediminilitoris]AXO80981.1 gliding motility lipoprotein GldD [Olleya aquimaris]MBL7560701.1 gliding motility lipoprotein GldD [Olleya sediminilitoris]